VNDDSSSNDIPYTKPVGQHGEIGPSIARQKRRQISGMLWMSGSGWIIMAACTGKILSGTAGTFMNMQCKKTGRILAWKPGYFGNHKNTIWFLEEIDFTR